jgi:carboxylate-amine ligase
MIDFGKQAEVPIRDLVLELLDFVDDVLDDLNCRSDVGYITKILEMGTGADRQLKVFKETGDLHRVVDHIIEETHLGITGNE